MGLQDDIDRILAEEAAKKEAERLAREARQKELAAYPVWLVSQEVHDELLEFTQIMCELNVSPLPFAPNNDMQFI